MARMQLCGVGVVCVLVASGCSDKTPPPAPRVHPLESPTSKATVTLTGAAEFGATVTVKGGKETVSVPADKFTAEWLAEVPLNTTVVAPDISVSNTLSVTATDAAGNESPATVVEVKFGPEPGVPSKLTFALSGAAAGGTITAGTDVTYAYQVTDAYDGPVANPLSVIPSDPNTSVFDDGISGTGVILGFRRTGSFTITARASGAAGVSKQVPLTVTAAAGPRFFDLALTLSRLATGDSTSAITVVKDTYGNVVVDDATGTAAGLTLACAPQNVSTPPTACARNGASFSINQAGVYKITATYDDGTNPSASNAQYVFAEDAPDVEPPVATITSVVYPTGAAAVPRSTNSRIEVAATFADNKALASAVLYAIFGNNPACISSSTTLLLTGQTRVTTNVSVRQPSSNCAFPNDGIGLFLSVVDEAGNQGFSPINSSMSVSGVGLGNLAAAGGATYTVAAFGSGNGGLSSGIDLSWDAAAQIGYVTNNNNNGGIGALLPDRTQQTVRDITGQTYQFNNNLGGLALSNTGDLFVSRLGGNPNTGSILFIPTSLPTNPQALVSNLSGPGRLLFSAAGVLCATKTASATSANCYLFNASTPSLTANFPNDVAATGLSGGNTELVGLALGPAMAGTTPVYLLYNAGGLYVTSSPFSTTPKNPPAPTAIAVTPALGNSVDVVGLPSGDLAVLTNNAVVRVKITGATAVATTLLTGLNSPRGLDFAGGQLFVLDSNSNNSVVLAIAAPSAAPF